MSLSLRTLQMIDNDPDSPVDQSNNDSKTSDDDSSDSDSEICIFPVRNRLVQNSNDLNPLAPEFIPCTPNRSENTLRDSTDSHHVNDGFFESNISRFGDSITQIQSDTNANRNVISDNTDSSNQNDAAGVDPSESNDNLENLEQNCLGNSLAEQVIRRSTRVSRAPNRYGDYVYF